MLNNSNSSKTTSPRRFIQGSVSSIDTHHILLESGQLIPFDYLVIATGSKNPSPAKTSALTKESYFAEISDWHRLIQSASNILIVGGGPVGVEIAGEIATDLPTKKVTLVHSGPHLIPGDNTSVEFKRKILSKLQKLEVNVILNDKVNLPSNIFPSTTASNMTAHSIVAVGPRTLQTTSGKSISSDLQLFTVGNSSYNSDFMKSFKPELVDQYGQIRVLSTLQVNDKSLPHIFALGDVIDFPVNKLAFIAGFQADIVAKNIHKIIVTQLKSKQGHGEQFINSIPLESYKAPTGKMMMVPTGRHAGNSQLPFTILGNYLTSKLKGKDYFLGNSVKEVKTTLAPYIPSTA